MEGVAEVACATLPEIEREPPTLVMLYGLGFGDNIIKRWVVFAAVTFPITKPYVALSKMQKTTGSMPAVELFWPSTKTVHESPRPTPAVMLHVISV